jgi:SAM-dependent methyltransferase
MTRERRLAFGDVAELYDRARPTYPAELVDDVLAFSGAVDSGAALEVGAGTGKATTLFAARGLEIVALEPSAEMAEVARRNLAGYEHVTIEPSDFEHWDARGRSFRLVFSAQAWHWIAPEVRYIRAREVLRTDGALAVFWNRPWWESAPLRDELAEAYRRTAPDLGAGVGPGPMHPAVPTPPEWWSDWTDEMAAATGFEAVESHVYRWTETYAREAYLQVLRTHSDHIVLGPERLQGLLDAVGEVIDRHGGTLQLDYVTVLWMARASGDGAAGRE